MLLKGTFLSFLELEVTDPSSVVQFLSTANDNRAILVVSNCAGVKGRMVGFWLIVYEPV